MRMNIRKGHLAEIYSGMAKLLSHTALGVQIQTAPGRVRAVGTNYGETLLYEAESPESENGEESFVLPTDPLKEIVSAYGSDTIITFTEKEEGQISAEWKTKGMASSLTFQTAGEYPEIKIPGEKTFKPLDRERFRAEYLVCAECTTDERARFNLECIALDGANHRMIATDGRQIYETTGIDFPWKDSCYLPTGKCFPEKLLLQTGNLEVTKTKEVLAFRNGAWTYLVKLREITFPPVDNLNCEIGDTELLLRVSEEDANRLIELLPHLPGKERRSSAVEFKAEQQITFSGQSKGTDSEASSQFALNSSHWIGGPFTVSFNREYLLRALQHDFRTFRFLPGNAPIVSETKTGKYLFMPMTIQEEEAQPEETDGVSSDEPQLANKERPAAKPNPAEVRKRRIDWLNHEALWLATELAEQHGFISPSDSPSPEAQIRQQMEAVLARLAGLSDKRRKTLTLEELLPPQDQPTWEEVGSFAREDGTLVHLVRSEEGFFSIRNGEAINLTSEDVSGILEPLLSHVWKPSCLALYYNGQRWWIEAEHTLSRKGSKAQRQLVVGVPRPASQGVIEWEIGLLQKLLDEPAESLPVRARENAERRLERLQTWLHQPAPQTLDLLSLCLALPATA